MKAARAWSVRPSALVDDWSDKDRVLAEALIEFEETAYCPKCGQLRSKAFSSATDGWWEQEKVHCFACEAQERAESQRSKGDVGASELEPGDMEFLTLDEGYKKD